MSETVTIRRETLDRWARILLALAHSDDLPVMRFDIAKVCAEIVHEQTPTAQTEPHPWQAGFKGVSKTEVEMAIGAAMVAHVTGIHQRDEQAMREFVQAAVSEAIAAHIQTAHLPANYVTTTARP